MFWTKPWTIYKLMIFLQKVINFVVLENFLAQKKRWVYKPALFGKGKGIIFGKNVKQ